MTCAIASRRVRWDFDRESAIVAAATLVNRVLQLQSRDGMGKGQ